MIDSDAGILCGSKVVILRSEKAVELQIYSHPKYRVYEFVATYLVAKSEAPRLYIDWKDLFHLITSKEGQAIYCAENDAEDKADTIAFLMDCISVVETDKNEIGFEIILNCESLTAFKNVSKGTSSLLRPVTCSAIVRSYSEASEFEDDSDSDSDLEDIDQSEGWFDFHFLLNFLRPFLRCFSVYPGRREGVDDLMEQYRCVDHRRETEGAGPALSSMLASLRVKFGRRDDESMKWRARNNSSSSRSKSSSPHSKTSKAAKKATSKVLFHGVGHCALGKVDVLIQQHKRSRVFELVVHCLDLQEEISHHYIPYNSLLGVVDQLQIQRAFNRARESVPGLLSTGRADAPTLLRNATLQVMTDHLLGHLVVYRLSCTEAVVVQIASDCAEGEGSAATLEVLTEPPPGFNPPKETAL